MKVCAVKSCSSRRKNKTKVTDVSSVSFFQPTSKTRLEAWSQSLGINLKPTDFVCQLHFKKQDIKFNYKNGNDNDSYHLKKKILKKFALPTVEYQEQYYPVKTEEIVDEEEILERKRKYLEKHQPVISQPIAYLKKKFSALPQHWSYVEKLNEIEFIKIDPVTKKIRNILVLKEDLTIMIIGANNKKIYLDDQISSPNDIYEYLKYFEEWTACVGTRIKDQKYSKKCKGIAFLDDTNRKNKIYPRCKPCKILRCALRNANTNMMQNKRIIKDNYKPEVLRQQLFGMEKRIINEETVNFNNFSRPQTITGVIDVDMDNIASIKEKIKTLWSSKQFCGLCYYNGDCCPINTELVINRQKYSKCLRDIVNYVFNNDAGNLMASPFICDSCVEKSIQTYIFIHNTRQMSQIMKNAVNDMYTKVNNVRGQLNIMDNDANMMIVLENDTKTYKTMINTKINEITPTSKPLPMKTHHYNDDNFDVNENNNEESTKQQDAKISKYKYEEIITRIPNIEMLDTNLKNDVNITKFIPITIPTVPKKSSKCDTRQIKRNSFGSITVMKDFTKDRPNRNTVFNVKSKTMSSDGCDLNISTE